MHLRRESCSFLGATIPPINASQAGYLGWHSTSFPWAYHSESDSYYNLGQVAIDGIDWSHNCNQYNVLSEGAKYPSLITNLTSTDADLDGWGNTAGWHADILVFSGTSDSNVIASGCIIRNAAGQPIWYSHGDGTAKVWTDTLYENCVFDTAPGPFKSGWGNGALCTFNHQLFRHCTWDCNHISNNDSGTPTASNFQNILYDGCVFNGIVGHVDGSGAIGDVTFRDNHFTATAYGTGSSLGTPGWDSNYYPTAGGNLTGVTIDVVPHDADGNERGPTTTAKGARRATDETL